MKIKIKPSNGALYLTNAEREISYDGLRLSTEKISDNEISVVNFLSKGRVVGKLSEAAMAAAYTSDGIQVRTLVSEESVIEFPEKGGTIKSTPIPKWEWTSAQRAYAEKFRKDSLYRIQLSISSKEIKVVK